jgi:hypothetical protein
MRRRREPDSTSDTELAAVDEFSRRRVTDRADLESWIVRIETWSAASSHS